MKIKLIACEVFTREVSAATAQSEHVFDSIYLPFGLHSYPDDLRKRLQVEIDATEGQGYDYIVLGYGLCSRGVADLVARSIPVVVTRAHDCITLFLGSRSKYSAEFSNHPGTYYYSSGWIERGDGDVEQGMISDKKERQYKEKYEEYVEKYGEDNAKFLIEQESQWLVNYTRAAFINTNTGPTKKFREFTQGIAMSRDWEFEEIEGDLSLIDRLAAADFSGEDFLVVLPGEHIAESFDDLILVARK
jgi:hypothetical protein